MNDDIFEPLKIYYRRSGDDFPKTTLRTAERVPEPYRSLLVHDNDMTPTLEQYHRSSLHLDVLSRFSADATYSRQVRLISDTSNNVVEFGAIIIFSELFPDNAKKQIVEARKPLGAILRDEKIAHTSNPTAYFEIEADGIIQRIFTLNHCIQLFGRCNVISSIENKPLAKIVEILPP